MDSQLTKILSTCSASTKEAEILRRRAIAELKAEKL